jgi:hypothetical protein
MATPGRDQWQQVNASVWHQRFRQRDTLPSEGRLAQLVRWIMTRSAFEPLQHSLQLCILQLKLARQLNPKPPDLFIKADRIIRNGWSAWRGWGDDLNDLLFPASSAALSRTTFVSLRKPLFVAGGSIDVLK